jgi:hypothetical protein
MTKIIRSRRRRRRRRRRKKKKRMTGRNFTDMKVTCLCPLVLLLKAWWREGGSVGNDNGLLEYAAGKTS